MEKIIDPGTAIFEAIRIIGLPKLLAELKVKPQQFNAWKNGREDVPILKALLIQILTKGVVRIHHLTLCHSEENKIIQSLFDCAMQKVSFISIAKLLQHNDTFEKSLESSSFFESSQVISERPIIIDQNCRLITGHERVKRYIALNNRQILAMMLNLEGLLKEECIIHDLHNLLISEKVAIGVAIERLIGKRQGQRTDIQHKKGLKETSKILIKKSELSENFREVNLKERTSKHIAKILGFGSDRTYEHAKKAIFKGSENLITVLDKRLISISKAEKFAKLPIEDQEDTIQIIRAKKEQSLCRLR